MFCLNLLVFPGSLRCSYPLKAMKRFTSTADVWIKDGVSVFTVMCQLYLSEGKIFFQIQKLIYKVEGK